MTNYREVAVMTDNPKSTTFVMVLRQFFLRIVIVIIGILYLVISCSEALERHMCVCHLLSCCHLTVSQQPY